MRIRKAKVLGLGSACLAGLLASCADNGRDEDPGLNLAYKLTLGAASAAGAATVESTRQVRFDEETVLIENNGYRVTVVPSIEEQQFRRPDLPSQRLRIDFHVYEPEGESPILKMMSWTDYGSENKTGMHSAEAPSPSDVEVEFVALARYIGSATLVEL